MASSALKMSYYSLPAPAQAKQENRPLYAPWAWSLSTFAVALIILLAYTKPTLRTFDISDSFGHHLSFNTQPGDSTSLEDLDPSSKIDEELACPPLHPLAEDILVVLKTGATAAPSRLPIHLRTTLRCIPHKFIYSDLAQTMLNTTILDVFDVNITAPFNPSSPSTGTPVSNTTTTILPSNSTNSHSSPASPASTIPATLSSVSPEFALHRLLRHLHLTNHTSLIPHLHDSARTTPTATKENGPGWRLDKFKFIPMLVGALQHSTPNTRWFWFAEADTYFSFRNLALWIDDEFASRVDGNGEQEEVYAGSATFVGNGPQFAHGGSGFLVSRTALESVVQAIQRDPVKFAKMTMQDLYGDDVVARAFLEVGVGLTGVQPVVQGEDVGSLDYAEVGVWCSRAVSWHRFVTPEMVRGLWAFEDKFWAERGEGEVMRRRDVFGGLVRKTVESGFGEEGRSEWDNDSRQRVLAFDPFVDTLPPNVTVDSLTPITGGSNKRKRDDGAALTDHQVMATLSAQGCAAYCKQEEGCKQWNWAMGECGGSESLRMGWEVKGVEQGRVSGWDRERVEKFMKAADESCPRPGAGGSGDDDDDAEAKSKAEKSAGSKVEQQAAKVDSEPPKQDSEAPASRPNDDAAQQEQEQ